MDKMYYTPIKGKLRPLNFSIDVMFDAAEKYGSMSEAFDIIEKENKESLNAIRWFLLRMANDAELVRRQEGYDQEEILTDEDIQIRSPGMYAIYKNAVLEAVRIGYTREVEDPKQEVDLVLQELNAKKEKAGE